MFGLSSISSGSIIIVLIVLSLPLHPHMLTH